ncbi:UDP-N-acetylglucosamine transporter UGNT1 isoform X1 [Lathyrus oleraceus]|nr:UDP-N-acetylglucosamine transporter UGNT1-like isoform X1 [Pisum sativum]
MSHKSSYSSENMLPVSDPPNDEDRERLLQGDDKIFRGSSMAKRGIFAAISYMSCAGSFTLLNSYSILFSIHVTAFHQLLSFLCFYFAVLLVMFNKAALSSYNFPSANFIALLQMVCSCCFLYFLRSRRIISFTAGEAEVISENSKIFVPLKTLRHTFPIAGSYLLYMLVTMESVRGVTVPMYTTLRRTTVVFTMLVEYMLVGQKYTRSIIFSVGLIVFGAFIAGARDLSFDAYGYAIVFLSNITTAIYLATIARVGKTSGLNSFGLMWCNGIISGPLLFIWTLVQGDLTMTINFPHLLSPGFIVVLLLSCILAFFLNYSIFLNTTLNSALTQTICGNMKDLFTIGFGWIIFGGLPFDFWNVIGQSLGFAGSGLYAFYKLIGK